jgi:hypothetical protein
MLSWEDIALTMREEHDLARLENSRLDQQVRHVRTLLYDMKQWVHATLSVCTNIIAIHRRCLTKIQVSPSHAKSSWRNFTLLKHPESRKLGMEWITQQLYHNLDDVQQRYGFPSMFSTVTEDDLNVAFDENGCYQFIRRHELFMHNSLDELRGVMQADIWQFMINYAKLNVRPIERYNMRDVQCPCSSLASRSATTPPTTPFDTKPSKARTNKAISSAASSWTATGLSTLASKCTKTRTRRR